MSDGLTSPEETKKPAKHLALASRLERVFDRAYYLSVNADVQQADIPPDKHYLAHGIRENRAPNAWFSSAYVRNQLNAAHVTPAELLERYLASDMPDRPRVLFVGHEASRTGAPAIILRLIEMFSSEGGVECITLLDEGGERLEDFRQYSHVYVMARSRREERFETKSAREELAALLGEHGGFQLNRPVIALVNSAESARIAKVLHQLNMPIVSLVHEFAAFYSASVFESLSEISRKLIVPSQFIRRTAVAHARLDDAKLVVRGQGLLDDGFGTLDADACRKQLRARLDLPADAFIVLNVGTLELRKGVDSFVQAACLFCQSHPEHDHVYFLWFGEETAASAPAVPFARELIAKQGLEDRIRFLPSTPLVEPIFQAADLFFLSARADPFPCVVHEALACAVPVVAYAGTGGAAELIGDDCGTLVEYGDHLAVCRAVHRYLTQPELLNEHAQHAVEKIKRDWAFADYFEFVRAEMQTHVQVSLSAAVREDESAETHLVMCPAHVDALAALEERAFDVACTHVLLPRPLAVRRAELQAGLEKLSARGVRSQMYAVPLGSAGITPEDLLLAVQRVRPIQLTVIGLEHEIDRDVLQLMAFKKRLVLPSTTVDRAALYRIGICFDEIVTKDASLGADMMRINPVIAERIKTVSAA